MCFYVFPHCVWQLLTYILFMSQPKNLCVCVLISTNCNFVFLSLVFLYFSTLRLETAKTRILFMRQPNNLCVCGLISPNCKFVFLSFVFLYFSTLCLKTAKTCILFMRQPKKRMRPQAALVTVAQTIWMEMTTMMRTLIDHDFDYDLSISINKTDKTPFSVFL